MIYSGNNLLTLIMRWSLFTMFLWLVFFSHIGSALVGWTPASEVLCYSHLVNILIGPFWSALIIIILVNNNKMDIIFVVSAIISGIFIFVMPTIAWVLNVISILVAIYILACFIKKENSLVFGQTIVPVCSLLAALYYGIEFGSACLLIFSGALVATTALVKLFQMLFIFISALAPYQKTKDFLLGKDLIE